MRSAVAVMALGLTVLPSCSHAFSRSSPTNLRPVAPTETTALQAKATPVTGPARLSHEEQKDLLKQAVELRRIKEIEKKLALHVANLQPSQQAIREEAGYGLDMEGFEIAIDQGHKARETLVTTNMGLVYHCVNEIIGKQKRGWLQSLSREDLIQEGAIGLARAVDRWNPEIGGKFSSYAYYWIRAAVFRCIAERDDLVRVPVHVSNAVNKMTKAAKSLGIDMDGENILSSVYGTDSTWEDAKSARALAEAAGLSDRQLAEAMKVKRRRRNGGVLSFESWMQRGRDFDATVLSSSEDDSSLASVQTEELKTLMSRFLKPRELEALCWRYGITLDNAGEPATRRDYVAEAEKELFGRQEKQPPVQGKQGEAMSFVEVSKRMQVSAEYCRRLCHGALSKLQRAAKEGAFPEPAFLM